MKQETYEERTIEALNVIETLEKLSDSFINERFDF